MPDTPLDEAAVDRASIIDGIHDVCAKCSDHCLCPGFVNAEGYWEYDA